MIPAFPAGCTGICPDLAGPPAPITSAAQPVSGGSELSAAEAGGGSRNRAGAGTSMQQPTDHFEGKAPLEAEFTIREKHLPQKLGLNLDHIRRLRQQHLTEGVDFISKKRGQKFLSPKGLQRLQVALEIPDTTPAKKMRPAANTDVPVVEEFLFLQAPANPRIIVAYPPDGDPADRTCHVRIRVSSSKNFRRHDNTGRPMIVPARRLAADLYELARPCPRYPGRW